MKARFRSLFLIIGVLTLAAALLAFVPAYTAFGSGPNDQIGQDQPTPEPGLPVQLPYPAPTAAQTTGGSTPAFGSGVVVGLVIAGVAVLLFVLGMALGRRRSKEDQGTPDSEK